MGKNYFKDTKNVYFAKRNEKAVLPSKEEENAGYDFYAFFDEDYLEIPPFETKLVPTGISWACSPEFYLQIEERSSTGSKGIKRSAGVVDSGYRGEIKIAITNVNNKPLIISNIDESQLRNKYNIFYDIIFYSTQKAIAQGIIHRVEKMNVSTLPLEELLSIPSSRGDKGFGSSNKVK